MRRYQVIAYLGQDPVTIFFHTSGGRLCIIPLFALSYSAFLLLLRDNKEAAMVISIQV